MIYEHQSYRTFLKQELVNRIQKNPKYSLRAMAQHLGFSHSTLSLVIKGSVSFSVESARKIALRLKLSATETEYFCLLVQLEAARDPDVRESILTRLQKLNPRDAQLSDLTLDSFKQRSEWYYSAIVGLACLPGVELSAKLIANRIGISRAVAELAIDRLIRLEFLKKDSKGKLVRVQDRLTLNSDASQDDALRKFYRQMFDQASVALETQSSQFRVSGFETFPLALEAIPEARKITEVYFREMNSLSDRYPLKKHVYHLLVHFFNLTADQRSSQVLKARRKGGPQ